MAEGYEEAGYHVPQQSRRDKLRVHHHHQQHHHHHVAQNNHQHQNNNSNLILHPHLYDPPSSDFLSIPKYHSSSNFMGFINNNNNSNSNSNSNSPPNLPLNPNHHHHQDPFINFNPSLFKPEPLSLSLSSSSHHDHHPTLNFHSYILPTAGVTIAGTASDVVSRCSDVLPFAPFTGYASILKGSRFLNPAQQLLEEFCDVVGAGMMILPAGVDRMAPDPALLDPPPLDCLLVDDDDDHDHDHPLSAGGAPDFGAESRRKKSRLISMLDEVYKRYKQYYQQMEAVVTSFECVAGLGNAAPYANLALKAMSKHFRSLKNAIADQLTRASSSGKNDDHHALTTTKLGNNSSSSSSTYAALRHNNGQGSGGGGGGGGGLIDHHQPVWRPQRGLPERAVTVLRAWLFEHFLHPYPTDTDKLMLAKQTGLSRSQVSNWFINARVRLWKPMVEEIHTLETRQAQKAAHKEDRSKSTTNADQQHQRPNSDAAGGGGGGSNPSTSSQPPAFDVPVPKRTRNNQLPPPPPHHNNITSSINDHHQHQHMYHHHNNNNNNNNNMESYGGGFSGTGQHHQTHLGSGGVSLTLGLHQHQGIGFLEPPPPSFAISSVAAQRFGLDGGGGHDGYSVMGGGGYDSSQNRHFGRDVIGGQLLHDFVG